MTGHIPNPTNREVKLKSFTCQNCDLCFSIDLAEEEIEDFVYCPACDNIIQENDKEYEQLAQLERAMEAGMAFGIKAYNEQMGDE